MTITRTTRTVTIDTASSPWRMWDGELTTVSSTDQTFQIAVVDDSGTATADYEGAGADQNVLLANGCTLKFSGDKRMVHIGDSLANATAKPNAGSLWVSEDGNVEHEVKITTVTLADADSTGANNITTITFEYPGKPWKWTWATINMA